MGIRDFFKKGAKEKDLPVADASEDANDSVGRILFQTRWRSSALFADNSLIQKVAEHIILEDPFCKPFGWLEDEAIARTNRRIYEYEQVTTLNVAIKDGNLMIEGLSLGKLPAEQWNEISPYYGKKDFTAFVYVTGGRYKFYSDDSKTVETAYTPYDLDIFIQFE
ncbi:Hypothetical protein TPAS_1109 [Trichococcus pasteurii]|uniref:Uncharacterized protein n=2 Tax=Trichococcus pasteurii TaxID=43064 RepID=A0A1W1IF84_9LACT|nr:hypothetical protein SAMN04488086_101303 [Trichococcus pasteurii]SLM51433.1 Hypothetical protein TPAS_1109 [Trichococcus pasteurii]SSB92314.1 Hypothetical protein TPAS_1109 [Trichococcus pasteurii]